ncbi:MAG TPA: hypothetical protein VN643_16075 [Pyrinomonadaceae bacterium]|nr:hypothetical protein [Pyrinomonadaceae bacterium]
MKRTLLLVFLLLAPLAVALQRPSKTNDSYEKAENEKWEYLAVAGPHTTNFSGSGDASLRKEAGNFAREGFVLEQHLDKLGAKGWELVSVAGQPTDPVYYFKRRK